MTSYFSGKNRIGKEIAEGVLSYAISPTQPYLEPFLGMGGVMRHIPATHPRTGNDLHPDVAGFWRALQRGWKPPKTVTQAMHARLKIEAHNHGLYSRQGRTTTSDDEPSSSKDDRTEDARALRAFVDFGCSFSGIYFQKFNPATV